MTDDMGVLLRMWGGRGAECDRYRARVIPIGGGIVIGGGGSSGGRFLSGGKASGGGLRSGGGTRCNLGGTLTA
jgi:hypothetical protein